MKKQFLLMSKSRLKEDKKRKKKHKNLNLFFNSLYCMQLKFTLLLDKYN